MHYVNPTACLCEFISFHCVSVCVCYVKHWHCAGNVIYYYAISAGGSLNLNIQQGYLILQNYGSMKVQSSIICVWNFIKREMLVFLLFTAVTLSRKCLREKCGKEVFCSTIQYNMKTTNILFMSWPFIWVDRHIHMVHTVRLIHSENLLMFGL